MKKIEAIRAWIRTNPTVVSYNLFIIAGLVLLTFVLRGDAGMKIVDWVVIVPSLVLAAAQIALHNMRDKTDREKVAELAQVQQSLNEAVKSIDEWREIARAQNERIEELERERAQHASTIELLWNQRKDLFAVLHWMFGSIDGCHSTNGIVLHALSAWLIDRKITVDMLGGAHGCKFVRCLAVLNGMRERFTGDFETWRAQREEQERLQSAIYDSNEEWLVGCAREIFINVASMNRVRRVPREVRSIQDELVLRALLAIGYHCRLLEQAGIGSIPRTLTMLGSYKITAEELQRILRDLQTNKGDQFAQILEQMPEDIHRFLTAIMANPTSVKWPGVDPQNPACFFEDDC